MNACLTQTRHKPDKPDIEGDRKRTNGTSQTDPNAAKPHSKVSATIRNQIGPYPQPPLPREQFKVSATNPQPDQGVSATTAITNTSNNNNNVSNGNDGDNIIGIGSGKGTITAELSAERMMP